MSDYVVDANVAIKWYLPEEHVDAARRLLLDEHVLAAPDFLLIEFDGVLSKYVRRNQLSLQEAEDARRLLAACPIRLEPFHILRGSGFDLAHRTGCSFYDALYLALAVRRDCEMVTADRRFFDNIAAGPFGGHVRWIGDLPDAG